MKLEELLKGTGRFVLKVGLTASVLTGVFVGVRYLNIRYETKVQEKVQKCIEEEGKYISNARDIEYFRIRVKKCLDNND